MSGFSVGKRKQAFGQSYF